VVTDLAPTPATARPQVRRVGVLSVHTSPLDRPGEGDGGGLNVSVDETSRRLADRGIDVDVYTRASDPDLPPTVEVHRGPTGAVYAVHHVAAGPVAPVAKSDTTTLLCGLLLALERRDAPRPDLLHGHYWLSGWIGRRLAARRHLPLVQTFHTLGVMKNAHLAPGDEPEPPLRLVAEAAVARAADRVTVLTCGEAALLHRAYGLSGGRLQVVPAGVDLSRFSPVPAPQRRDGRAPTLLFVGRLQPLKGPDVAVRTLAAVRETVPDARLRIVGGTSGSGAGASDPPQLRALATDLGVADAVTIEPAVDQATLARTYREADVLVAPSRSETFGLVALEAQASGLPVVAADVPGLQAVVGAGGTLVRGHDPSAHAAAVVRYLTDPETAAAAGRAGVATAARASWDRTVDRLVEVYDAVLDEHRAGDAPTPTDDTVEEVAV
jgi:D-inositol-3-phosphate glycosyltransferase